MISGALSFNPDQRNLELSRTGTIPGGQSPMEVLLMTSKISILKSSMFAVIVATLPLAAANASAQTRHVAVDVPFAFVANHTSFPAGHYTIIGDGPFMRLSNTDT